MRRQLKLKFSRHWQTFLSKHQKHRFKKFHRGIVQRNYAMQTELLMIYQSLETFPPFTKKKKGKTERVSVVKRFDLKTSTLML